MICAVERERSFCALKSFKVGFIGERTNVPFFEEICVVNLSCFYFTSGTKVGVWKTASFLSSCIPGFFYSPRSYYDECFQPSNTARGATSRSHTQWTRALPHRQEECCYATKTFWSRVHRVILLLKYCTI